jgi:hypothetical protein
MSTAVAQRRWTVEEHLGHDADLDTDTGPGPVRIP